MTRARETGDFGHLTHLRNKIIDGGFECWDEGVSIPMSANIYHATMWDGRQGGSGVGTWTREAFTIGQTEVPNNPKYFLRHTQTAIPTSTPYIRHHIEDVRTLADGKVALSFYMKADKAITVSIRIVQDFGTTGSSAITTTPSDADIITSWQKFERVVDLPSIAGKTIDDTDCELMLSFDFPLDTFTVDIAQVQLEADRVTPFEILTIDQTRRLVDRFYETTYGIDLAIGASDDIGARAWYVAQNGGNQEGSDYRFRTEKRVTPTMRIFSTADGAEGYVFNRTGGNHLASIGNSLSSQGWAFVDEGDALGVGDRCLFHFIADARL